MFFKNMMKMTIDRLHRGFNNEQMKRKMLRIEQQREHSISLALMAA